MTKPVFDAYTPLPGSENAPIITAEQMSRFLYSDIGAGYGKKIANILNECHEPYSGALQTTYVAPEPPVTSVRGFDIGATVYSKTNKTWTGPMTVDADQYTVLDKYVACVHPRRGRGGFSHTELTTDETQGYGYVPPKPAFLPIDRPVRIKDVEVGDVLRFCGDATGTPWLSSYDNIGLGTEVVVKEVDALWNSGHVRLVEDNGSGLWAGRYFSFVRRPFKEGEVVAYADQSEAYPGYAGNLLVQRNEADQCPYYGIWVITAAGKTGSIDKNLLKRVL